MGFTRPPTLSQPATLVPGHPVITRKAGSPSDSERLRERFNLFDQRMTQRLPNVITHRLVLMLHFISLVAQLLLHGSSPYAWLKTQMHGSNKLLAPTQSLTGHGRSQKGSEIGNFS